MGELIECIVADAGVDKTATEISVVAIFDFLRKQGPADEARAPIDNTSSTLPKNHDSSFAGIARAAPGLRLFV